MERNGELPSFKNNGDFANAKRSAFSTTHWANVITAATDLAGKEAALEELCQKYWHPIYAFIRRRGWDAHQAEDLTQSFFAYLLEKEALKKASRKKGKFRTFLLAALTNFLANEWDKQQTLKRGGRQKIFSLEEIAHEEIRFQDLADSASPEKSYDRTWALTLVAGAQAQLKNEYGAQGKENLFAALNPCLTGEVTAGAYAAWSRELGMSPEALKVALHRMRRRFGELLRHGIAQTVENPAELEEEIRHVFAALAN